MITQDIIKHIDGLRCSGESEWAQGVNAGIDQAVAALRARFAVAASPSSAPKTIYLDIGDGIALERIQDGGKWNDEGVTWSEDNATGHGIRYVLDEGASTASAITEEQVEAAYVAFCTGSPKITREACMRRALEAAFALAAPTAQPTGPAVEPSQPAPDDAMTAAYMAACKGRAPDHNEIGLHYFRAAWAASRTPAPAASSAWQPIESVVGSPDDILLLKTTGKQAIETGWYARNLLDDAIREGDTCVYTAWMHLPAAIASSTKASGGTEHG